MQIKEVPTVATLADHGSAEVKVFHLAHGSTEGGWGHAYFRAHCDLHGWVGHEQGYPNPLGAEKMAVRHANTEPHDPKGANRWIDDTGAIAGYDGAE